MFYGVTGPPSSIQVICTKHYSFSPNESSINTSSVRGVRSRSHPNVECLVLRVNYGTSEGSSTSSPVNIANLRELVVPNQNYDKCFLIHQSPISRAFAYNKWRLQRMTMKLLIFWILWLYYLAKAQETQKGVI